MVYLWIDTGDKKVAISETIKFFLILKKGELYLF